MNAKTQMQMHDAQGQSKTNTHKNLLKINAQKRTSVEQPNDTQILQQRKPSYSCNHVELSAHKNGHKRELN